MALRSRHWIRQVASPTAGRGARSDVSGTSCLTIQWRISVIWHLQTVPAKSLRRLSHQKKTRRQSEFDHTGLTHSKVVVNWSLTEPIIAIRRSSTNGKVDFTCLHNTSKNKLRSKNKAKFVFAARCYTQARPMPSCGVCLSVCPSLCLSVCHVRVFCRNE